MNKHYLTKAGKLQYGLKFYQKLFGHSMTELDPDYLEFQMFGMATDVDGHQTLASSFDTPKSVEFYDVLIRYTEPDEHIILEEVEDLNALQAQWWVAKFEAQYKLTAEYI